MRKLVVLLTLLSGAIVGAERSAQPSRFTLSVDSIMRGPALVGYPPSDLRWAGDSKELYFEWRQPKEDGAVDGVVRPVGHGGGLRGMTGIVAEGGPQSREPAAGTGCNSRPLR